MRPDFSDYLVHFTVNSKPKGDNSDNPIKDYENMTAFERLINILKDQKIVASRMPWSGCRAVCFTECPWSSLLDHTTKYSPFGLGFHKAFIFSRNGSPVYYVRPDQFEKQEWHEDLYPFVTPFWPKYRPGHLKEKYSFQTCDYSHEREWRTPHDLCFDYSQISFVIINTYEELNQIPEAIRDSVGNDKFVLMENYRKIERLWPVHLI